MDGILLTTDIAKIVIHKCIKHNCSAQLIYELLCYFTLTRVAEMDKIFLFVFFLLHLFLTVHIGCMCSTYESEIGTIIITPRQE